MDLFKLVERNDVESIKRSLNECTLPKDSDYTDYSLLNVALSMRREEIAKYLLQIGCRVNKPGQIACNTPLHNAIKNGNQYIVTVLLDKGASVTVANPHGNTPLHYAVKTRSEAIISMIVKRLTDENSSTQLAEKFGFTPLLIAILWDEPISAETLLRSGANANGLIPRNLVIPENGVWMDEASVDWSGYTYLHLAVEHERTRIVEILLQYGADASVRNAKGLTPLHLAASNVDQNTVNTILTAYKDENLRSIRNRLLPGSNMSVESLVNLVDNSGNTALHTAFISFKEKTTQIYQTLSGYALIETAKLLLNDGAKVNAKNSNELSPFYLAVDNGNLEVTQLMLSLVCEKCQLTVDEHSHGSKIISERNESSITAEELVNIVPEKSGITLLHLALKGRADMVRLLLNHGANRNVTDSDGSTLLHLAAKKDNAKIVHLLLSEPSQCQGYFYPVLEIEGEFEIFCPDLSERKEAYMDVNAVDASGNTPLHYAVKKRGVGVFMAKILLYHGADVSLRNRENLSPLLNHSDNKTDLLKLMSSKDCSHLKGINPTNKNGFSHFHAACMNDEPNIVAAFIDLGPKIVDVNARVCPNSSYCPGFTPLHFAAENNCPRVTAVLMEHGAEVNSKILNICARNGLRSGKTPLHLAARSGSIQNAKLLLYNGADMEICDADGNNVLHEVMLRLTRCNHDLYAFLNTAAENNYQQFMNLLLEFNCDVNAQNKMGKSALHFAGHHRNSVCIRSLLYYDADINIRDRKGKSPASVHLCVRSRINNELVCTLCRDFREHMIKMRALGKSLNECNQAWLTKTSTPDVLQRDAILETQCTSEVVTLKNVRVFGSLSLCDILFKTVYGMRRYVRTDVLRRLVESRNFNVMYPMYGYFIELKVQRSLRRWEHFDVAMNSLRSMTKLPDLCCEEILCHLGPEHLKKFLYL